MQLIKIKEMLTLHDIFPPTEGIKCQEPNTALFANKDNVGDGTLFVTESLVAWITNENKGFLLPYPNIVLHAISRDLNKFPQECLYVHTDAQIRENSASEESEEDEAIDESPPITELFFVPTNKESLHSLFREMAHCQALHPDPHDDFGSDGDEDMFGDPDGSDVGEADLQLADMHLNGNGNGYQQNGNEDCNMDPDRFEDAEENSPNH